MNKEATIYAPIVWGSVAGAKQLQLYRGGWHAKEAQIIGLLLPSDKKKHKDVLRIAERYGIPCVESQAELVLLGDSKAGPIDPLWKRQKQQLKVRWEP